MHLALDKQKALIRRTMTLAEQTAAEGNLPFAALLVDGNGTVVLEAMNTVNSTHNEAAHAEINLLFAASLAFKAGDLSAYALVANAASCPMCVTAMIKSKITNFYYGAINEGTMVPNITMAQVIAKLPFPVAVHGNILADECAAQIQRLVRR